MFQFLRFRSLHFHKIEITLCKVTECHTFKDVSVSFGKYLNRLFYRWRIYKKCSHFEVFCGAGLYPLERQMVNQTMASKNWHQTKNFKKKIVRQKNGQNWLSPLKLSNFAKKKEKEKLTLWTVCSLYQAHNSLKS